MFATVLFRDETALARLNELGLRPAILSEAVHAAAVAHRSCDEDHPLYYPGIAAHSTAVWALRQALKATGWGRETSNGVALVSNSDRKLALGVTTGDEHTGNPSLLHAPRTKNRKGGGTEAVVARNRAQMDLPFDLGPGTPEGEEVASGEGVDAATISIRGDLFTTYYLVYHFAPDLSRASLELSMPSAFEDGRIVAWRERIVLPDLDLGLPPVMEGSGGPDDGGMPIVVEVSRKK